MTLAALLLGIVLGVFVSRRRGCHIDQRLGMLPMASPASERAERLAQLGTAGTYRVYNCGTILHVDYVRGELIVERRSA